MRFAQSLEKSVRRFRDLFNPLVYMGNKFFCPVCRRRASRFKSAGSGYERRQNAVCPFCKSRERDRLTSLFFDKYPSLLEGNVGRLLHVAPEPALEPFFRKQFGQGYLSVDIYRRDVMETMDITDIHYPNDTFNAIFCSHVLQNIKNDRLAMEQIFRVLQPGAWAILNVPLRKLQSMQQESGLNKSSLLDPNRPDGRHRLYGEDYVPMLQSVGFEVEEYGPDDLEIESNLCSYGLAQPHTGYIHFCRKPLRDND